MKIHGLIVGNTIHFKEPLTLADGSSVVVEIQEEIPAPVNSLLTFIEKAKTPAEVEELDHLAQELDSIINARRTYS